MKAVVYEEYAADDDFRQILKVKDVDEPKPKPNEVVFQVKAAALNYNDIWGMRGAPIPVPLPHISGSDTAGEVIAVGDEVRNLKVGDRVVSHANLNVGEHDYEILTSALDRHRDQAANAEPEYTSPVRQYHEPRIGREWPGEIELDHGRPTCRSPQSSSSSLPARPGIASSRAFRGVLGLSTWGSRGHWPRGA